MFEISKLNLPVKDSEPYTFKEPYEDFIQKIKDCLDPKGIMNPDAWFKVSGAQFRVLEAMDLPDSKE